MSYNFPRRLVKIGTQTASSSASLSFTSGISSNFSTYYIKIRNLIPATNNVSLLLTMSTDGGSTYLSTNYKWTNWISRSTGTPALSSSGSDSSITLATALSNTSSKDLNGEIILYGLVQTTLVPKIVFHNASHNTTPVAQVCAGGGMNTSLSGVNAIKIAASSGNITSGSIILYGLTEGGFLY